MRQPTIILLLLSTLLVTSCSTVNLATRKGKDIQLTAADYSKLRGTFSNLPIDTLSFDKTLFNNFRKDFKIKYKGYKDYFISVDIIPVDATTLTINLNDLDTLIKSITLKGKFKDGYFKVHRHYPTKFIAGPLLWVTGEHQNYVGLTKDNNLVVFNSGGKGVMLFIIFPFFVAGGDSYDKVYRRTK